MSNVYLGTPPANSIYNYKIKYLDGTELASFSGIIYPDTKHSLVGTTSDGTIVSFNELHGYGAMIFVDVNGLKSPNTIGRDIFVLSDFDYNGTVIVTPFLSKIWNNKYDMFTMTEDERIKTINEDCVIEVAELMNFTCAEKIIMDGWKMNY